VKKLHIVFLFLLGLLIFISSGTATIAALTFFIATWFISSLVKEKIGVYPLYGILIAMSLSIILIPFMQEGEISIGSDYEFDYFYYYKEFIKITIIPIVGLYLIHIMKIGKKRE
jgi:hypothetical protein